MDIFKFLDAQENTLRLALAELRGGQKLTHWMWFVFPQLASLGRSQRARFYGLKNLEEARAYLADPELGPRLETSIRAAMSSGERDPVAIFGEVDAMKFRSCLTLFEVAGLELCVSALEYFYGGERDPETLRLLRRR